MLGHNLYVFFLLSFFLCFHSIYLLVLHYSMEKTQLNRLFYLNSQETEVIFIISKFKNLFLNNKFLVHYSAKSTKFRDWSTGDLKETIRIFSWGCHQVLGNIRYMSNLKLNSSSVKLSSFLCYFKSQINYRT